MLKVGSMIVTYLKWGSISTNNVSNSELCHLFKNKLGIGGSFHPLHEVIYGHEFVFVPINFFWSDYVTPLLLGLGMLMFFFNPKAKWTEFHLKTNQNLGLKFYIRSL